MNTTHHICTFLTLLLLSGCQTAPTQATISTETSPHAQAIQMVMQTQSEAIRKADQGNWWHDTKSREWVAQRPFAPGTIDSTHLFNVTYTIDGVAVSSWLVDTRTRSVQIRKEK